MKTISDYSIYCTPEQTKKALALGAPIEHSSSQFDSDCTDNIELLSNGLYAIIPTAEQMLGWLEEMFDLIDIAKTSTICWSFRLLSKNREPILGFDEENRGYSSRKEATIAAIDAALEYLSNQQNEI